MKNTWLEISLGSLTSLFPDFHRTCLSCQKKLRHISWVKEAIVRFLHVPPHKSLKKQEEISGWQTGDIKLLLLFSLLCVSVFPVALFGCGDLSAGSDSFPSKLHVPLPPWGLLKADVQGELCYDALLWADFIPWLGWWDASQESWRRSPRGFKPISLS